MTGERIDAGFTPEEFRVALDARLVPDPDGSDHGQLFVVVGSGRVAGHQLFEGWLRQALDELAESSVAGQGDHIGDAVEEMVGWILEDGEEAAIEYLSGHKPEWVVRCGNPGGLYELWGMMRFEVAGRGYLYAPSSDSADGSLLCAWEPANDENAFRGAVLHAYRRFGEAIGLPPWWEAECVDADPRLLVWVFDQLFARDGGAPDHRYFADIVGSMAEDTETGQTLREFTPTPAAIAEAADTSSETADRVLRSLLEAPDELASRIAAGNSTDAERKAVLAIYLDATFPGCP